MPIECAGLTDVGRKREHNEDSLLLAPRHGLVVVADGMGGHQAGEVASNLAISTIEQFFDTCADDPEVTWPFRMDQTLDETANRLAVAVKLANQRIRDAARTEAREGMGTTCVAAQVGDGMARFAWVGDSRGYCWRDGALLPITTDHSLLNEMIRAGRLQPEDAHRFQHRNVITRALGMADSIDVEVATTPLEPGDVVLICSDGLTGMVDDARLAELLSSDVPLEAACQAMINAANSAGGSDNITVALVRCLR